MKPHQRREFRPRQFCPSLEVAAADQFVNHLARLIARTHTHACGHITAGNEIKRGKTPAKKKD